MSLLDLIKNIRLYLAEKINAYNFVNWGAITNLVPEGLAALLVVDWGFARLQEYLELGHSSSETRLREVQLSDRHRFGWG